MRKAMAAPMMRVAIAMPATAPGDTPLEELLDLLDTVASEVCGKALADVMSLLTSVLTGELD